MYSHHSAGRESYDCKENQRSPLIIHNDATFVLLSIQVCSSRLLIEESRFDIREYRYIGLYDK